MSFCEIAEKMSPNKVVLYQKYTEHDINIGWQIMDYYY